MHYEVDVGGVLRRVELPFVTAVFADLRGQPADTPERVEERRLIEIDRERFDAVMAELAPRVSFRVPKGLIGESELDVELNFRRASDFEPEAWMRQVESLRPLLEDRDALTPERRATFDELASRICHHESFKQLEATWRGLHRLVTQSECDETLKIRVLSLSKVELGKTLKRYKGTAWDQSPIFKRLYSDGYGSFGGEPIGCVVLDFAFDHSPRDVEMLGELGRIAAASHVPMLAAAEPALFQMDSWQELSNPRDLQKIFMTPEYEAWRRLRDSGDSRYLVLTLPRYLARAPHGDDDDANGTACVLRESAMSHADFLWGNAAYLLAEKLHHAFKIHGWCARFIGLIGGAVEGLPQVGLCHLDGEQRSVCATEVAVDERRRAELADAGLLPIVSRTDLGVAVFMSATVLNRPAQFDDPDATDDARRAADLHYVFATARIAHYLKAIERDVLAPISHVQRVKDWLRTWIGDYADPSPGAPDAFAYPARPFASVEVEVRESHNKPGKFNLKFWLQLAEWVTSSVRPL